CCQFPRHAGGRYRARCARHDPKEFVFRAAQGRDEGCVDFCAIPSEAREPYSSARVLLGKDPCPRFFAAVGIPRFARNRDVYLRSTGRELLIASRTACISSSREENCLGSIAG